MFFQWISLFTFSNILKDATFPINKNSATERINIINGIIQTLFGNDRPTGRGCYTVAMEMQIAVVELDMMFRYCQYLIRVSKNDKENRSYMDACQVVSFAKARAMFQYVHERILKEPARHPNWRRDVADAIRYQLPRDWVIVLAKYCEHEPEVKDSLIVLPCQVIPLLKEQNAGDRLKRLRSETVPVQIPESYSSAPAGLKAQPTDIESLERALMDESDESPSSPTAIGGYAAMLEQELKDTSTAVSSSDVATSSSYQHPAKMFDQIGQPTISPSPHVNFSPCSRVPSTFQVPCNALIRIPVVHDVMDNPGLMGFLRDMGGHIKRDYVDLKKSPSDWVCIMVRHYQSISDGALEVMFSFCQKEVRNAADRSDYWNACMVVSILRALGEFSRLHTILTQQGNQQDHRALMLNVISKEWRSVLIEYCEHNSRRMRSIVQKKYDHVCRLIALKEGDVTRGVNNQFDQKKYVVESGGTSNTR